MREQMSQALNKAFGPCARKDSDCDWWVIKRDGHSPMHVCLNAPRQPEIAHILIFDPASLSGEHVHDIVIGTPSETHDVIRRIKDLIPPTK
ncbi:MAG: hypothetical protein ACREJO_04765 [Phycisphaerales bacterium]